ncbi:TPA: DUF1642 domain-containing protein [Streptococcus agalactiae]|nr:DUF1642 domain-containing protein [Streptococcus agalactiae]
MNIEEAKKLIDKQSIGKGGVGDIPVVKTHIVKVLLDQLDQPQPEVPQMIFDVIKSFDDDVDYLHQHMSRQSDEVREWLTHNEREFYEAWLAYPNITIEKEKLYTVEIPSIYHGSLGYSEIFDNVSFYNKEDATEVRFELTEQEIQQTDERLLQFAKEVTE